jgi:hypothetical protein
MIAAVFIAGYALFVPLRLGAAFTSRRFLGAVSLASGATLAVAATAYLLSFAVDSSVPVLAFAGNLLFAGLLVCTGAVAVRSSSRTMVTSAPRIARIVRYAVERIDLEVRLLSLYIASRR